MEREQAYLDTRVDEASREFSTLEPLRKAKKKKKKSVVFHINDDSQ